MRTNWITSIVAFLICAVCATSCINGSPGKSGNSTVAKQTTGTTATANESAAPELAATEPEVSVYPTSAHPTINVYLEISGSMNGYVNGGTSVFQQVVKEYLSGINNAGFASSVNYFYISNQITPKGTDLDGFITKLTPSSFKASGGGATTDIGGLFKTILGKTDNNTGTLANFRV